MEKYIAIMSEIGIYDDNTKYEFESERQRYNFIKDMRGVLTCREAYVIKVKNDRCQQH